MGIPDRTWRNSDGTILDGYDDGTGMTDWYEHGTDILDSRTPTPSESEQEQNDAGY